MCFLENMCKCKVPYSPPLHVGFFSYEAYELFSDEAWMNLLRGRGIDITRPLRYSVTLLGVFVYYDDTFIGGEI